MINTGLPQLSALFTILITAFSLTRGDRLSACFNSTQKSIDIVCGAGAMVRILKAFYGYSASGSCQYQEHDCILPEFENYQCVGQESCSINLPTGTFGSLIRSCGSYSNYFQVEYECVQASIPTNICDNGHLTEQSGYIVTPRYPNNYHDITQCSISIEVHPSQKIKLHIIDMHLQPIGKTNCADSMYFNDGFHSITLCGRRANDTHKTISNKLEIELQARPGGNSKGFWLFYEAYPPLPSTTTSASTKRTTTTRRPVDTHKSTTLSTEAIHTNAETTTPIPVFIVTPEGSKSSLPFAAIAGGVIGTLSVILIILLTLLVIKWFKERRYYQEKDQFLDHRNPAFRSSGDFHTCTVDVDYYHC